ncbi:MAG: efflux RND transporter periplasmic adaptor subunit [Firmicutes bacterium]|nr:efflux RND transporter periplasmic adaptor subunit [Bacillota bacterium]
MRRITNLGIILVLLGALVVVAGCGKSSSKSTMASKTTPVKVVKVSTGDIISASNYSGKIAAAVDISVVPKASGKVAEVPVKVGDVVKKGQVLVKLDGAELAAQVRQAQATLNMCQANAQVAQQNLRRMEELFRDGAVSQSQLDAARGNAEATSAQVQQAAATLDLMSTQYRNTIIEAPQAGLISSVRVEVGEMASPSMPVVNIVDISKVSVEVNVAESDINKLKAGQEIKVKVPAVSTNPFTGKVTSIAPAADPVTKAFPVKVEIPNPEQLLKPGMFAEVELSTEKRENVIVIPKEAVLKRADRTIVFVVQEGKAIEREVKVGLTSNGTVEIISGLNVGEEVVVTGQNSLQNQMPVQVVTEGANS